MPELKGDKLGPIPTVGSLLHHHFFWLVLAVYLGGVVEKFFTKLTADVIVPFMDAVLDFDAKAGGYAVHWRGQTFKFGDVIVQAFNLALAVLLCFVVVRGLMLFQK